MPFNIIEKMTGLVLDTYDAKNEEEALLAWAKDQLGWEETQGAATLEDLCAGGEMSPEEFREEVEVQPVLRLTTVDLITAHP